MKSRQAWGWLTAGVLALGLNGFYQDGGAAFVHRMVGRATAEINERTGGVLALAAGRADWLLTRVNPAAGDLARANAVAARSKSASCRWANMVARAETKLARDRRLAGLEVVSAREEAALAEVETDRARMEEEVARTESLAAMSPVICSRIRVRVPRLRVAVPQVHLDMVSAETE